MTQKEALDILKMGGNVFLTGPAGSGKTHLLNTYIQYLKKHKVPVAITASTGIAATHMNGRTIHSWSAIGIRNALTKKELDALYAHEEVYQRINTPKVLIIDEISMLDAITFNLVDLVCKTLRRNILPFGGLQVVLCGDFFQLPPVSKWGEPQAEFAFLSSSWNQAEIDVCYLEKQYRQRDTRFLEVLNSIRSSSPLDAARAILMERHHHPIKGVEKPTRLHTHNDSVNSINDYELTQIDAEERTYDMSFDGNSELVHELKRSCLAPEHLTLKIGASVMFVKNNFDGGYVNGTLGTVVDFEEGSSYPIVEKKDGTQITAVPSGWSIEEDDKVLARITQIPLRLAWAITVHKSQGMSLDYAEIDLSRAFIRGMGYVALSRVRTLAGIKLMGLNKMALQINPAITEFDKQLVAMSKATHKSLKRNTPSTIKKIHREFLARSMVEDGGR